MLPVAATPNSVRTRFIDSVVARTFGLDTALDRMHRFVRPAHHHDNVQYNYYLDSSFNHTSLPGMSPQSIAFYGYNELSLHAEDKYWVETMQAGWFMPWCVLDMVATIPTRIIPSRLFIPYAGTRRREAFLLNTDMLPIFFTRTDGGVGVSIRANANYNVVPDIPTRLSASSLKVVLNLLNYSPDERQIQLRTLDVAANISSRRLARLVAAKVRNCLEKAEQENASISLWEDTRWRFGSSPGCIGIGDVELLGIVFVSPGKVTPLLQVRSEFVFAH